jgi:hypothetical protein
MTTKPSLKLISKPMPIILLRFTNAFIVTGEKSRATGDQIATCCALNYKVYVCYNILVVPVFPFVSLHWYQRQKWCIKIISVLNSSLLKYDRKPNLLLRLENNWNVIFVRNYSSRGGAISQLKWNVWWKEKWLEWQNFWLTVRFKFSIYNMFV